MDNIVVIVYFVIGYVITSLALDTAWHFTACKRPDNALTVVLPYIGDNIAYQHGLHFCQEVYSYRNQNKV